MRSTSVYHLPSLLNGPNYSLVFDRNHNLQNKKQHKTAITGWNPNPIIKVSDNHDSDDHAQHN